MVLLLYIRNINPIPIGGGGINPLGYKCAKNAAKKTLLAHGIFARKISPATPAKKSTF